MPSNRERKLQLREQRIFESAAHLIDQVGYTQLTMNMLAEESGIAKATLYQHFKSKEDVMITATLRALSNLESFMKVNHGTAIQQMQQIMRYMMQSGASADGFPSMIMHDEMLHFFRDHDEIGLIFQRLSMLLFNLVKEAKADGDIAADFPESFVVSMMMTNIQVMKGQIAYPGSTDTNAVIGHTLRVFFNGLKFS